MKTKANQSIGQRSVITKSGNTTIPKLAPAVMGMLVLNAGPFTDADIDRIVFGPKLEKVTAIKWLFQAKLVIRTGTGGDGSPFFYQTPFWESQRLRFGSTPQKKRGKS